MNGRMYIKALFYLSGWITGQVLLTPLYIFIYIFWIFYNKNALIFKLLKII